jgi:hypothetical protein
MKLRWRRSSRIEEAFESWFRHQYQELVLSGRVSSPGELCPDEAFLRDLARKSSQIRFSDLRVEHAASCQICMGRLLGFRKRAASQRRRLILATAVISCLLIAVSVVLSVRHVITSRQPTVSAFAITRTVDLSSQGTFRGEQPSQVQSVSLPKGVVKLTLILPRFSEPGQYAVAVTRSRSDVDLVAGAKSFTKREGDSEELSVLLDLTLASPGRYFLSTTREQDEASYYYPLEIQ